MGNNNSRAEASSSKNEAGTTSDKDKLLLSWNIAAAATVLLPILLFSVARISNGFGGEGGGGGEDGWWWSRERGPENQGEGAVGFVYLWTLIVFALLVWRGNKVLGNNKDGRALFAALVVFANLAFLCMVLIGGLGMGEEGGGEEGWLNRFSAAIVLTMLFWTIFGVVFASIMYQKVRKPSSSSFFGSSRDYQRQDDGGII